MGFLDPFGDGTSVISGGGGLSRPSARKRASSRARSHKKKRSRSRSSSRHRSHGNNLGAGLSSFFGVDDHHHKRSSSRHRGHGNNLGAGLSSFFGNDSHYNKHSSSRASFFGLGDDRNRSRGSFFGFSKPSYYKRSSRHGFVHRTTKQIKRLFRDLVHWAKRHPWKVFFLVLMPLLSGGILTGLLARFGLKLPSQLERLLGVASKAAVGDAPGLVGEAVKMAGNFTSSSRDGPTSVRVHDRDTGYGWEKDYRHSGDAWGDTVTSMAKMFI